MNKAINGYPNYTINEAGEVTNIETGKTLKPWEDNGYLRIGLYKNEGRKFFPIHRLIYQAFVREIPAGLEIDHIDGNRANNTLSNLRLVTSHENKFNIRGAKGYTFNKVARKWQAQISVNNKLKNLGYFDAEEDARAAYLSAKEKYHVIEVRS